MPQSYSDFLKSKTFLSPSCGIEVDDSSISDVLFPFQRQLTKWALRKGRSAIFADTGLGKTIMQLEWARHVDGRVLIAAPLAVAGQTVREARDLLDLKVEYDREGTSAGQIVITNYEMLGRFDLDRFTGIVLDESSILKSVDGKTKSKLTKSCASIPYRLCCTATPAPNDITEIANHAEFLGVMTRAQMLGSFFVNNSSDKVHGGWKLKGHAEQTFYRWLASWGMSVKKPSDIGFSDEGYDLPDLNIEMNFVVSDYRPRGELLFTTLKGITERCAVRKATITQRVGAACDIVNATDGQWIVWCGMNEESSLVSKSIDGSAELKGSQPAEHKISVSESFQNGTTRVLVTKPKISGFGMNFQNCSQMVFVGLSDSWEAYYQCIRRCWRFGQTKPVTVHIVLSEPEKAIHANIMRKEKEATRMSSELISHVKEYEREEVGGVLSEKSKYDTDNHEGQGYRMLLGDSAERLGGIDEKSVDLSVFSPPFANLFSYSDSPRDLGNSRDYSEFFEGFAYISRQILRVTRPGRNCCVHCQQISLTKIYDGKMGMRDFRGDVIRCFQDQGWTLHGEVTIDKDPQAQAIRTKAKGLLFVTKERDSVDLRPAYADYILVFRAPGENKVPVKSDISNDEWISWARPIWYGIKETETLQYRRAREEKDEKHICPLQMGTVERCVRLWSNPGETVLSPFAGIGTEGYVALQHRRKFIGIELKRSYYETAIRNIEQLIHERSHIDMIEIMESDRSSHQSAQPTSSTKS